MELNNLRMEKRPPLAFVTLDRPKALNALNVETLRELESVLEDLAGDSTVRVVLLTGAGGRAFAAGCELAMACTLRIAADDARLGQPEVKLGIIAGYGGTQRLPRLVGRGAALKLLLTGAIIDAREALRIGLVDEVVPAPDLMTRAEALATEIAANAPIAISETLRAVDEGLSLPLELALLREAARFGELCATADKAEGAAAFLEKRPPNWKGQ
jgi:enoyl-CoA hydratase